MDGMYFSRQRGYCIIVAHPHAKNGGVQYLVHGSFQKGDDWYAALICCGAISDDHTDPYIVQYKRDDVNAIGIFTGSSILYKNKDGSDAEEWTRVFLTIQQYNWMVSPSPWLFLSRVPYTAYISNDGCLIIVQGAGLKSFHAVLGAQRTLSTDINWHGEIIHLPGNGTQPSGLIQLCSRRSTYSYGTLREDTIVFKDALGSTKDVWTRTYVSGGQLRTIRQRPRLCMTFMLVYIGISTLLLAKQYLRSAWNWTCGTVCHISLNSRGGAQHQAAKIG